MGPLSEANGLSDLADRKRVLPLIIIFASLNVVCDSLMGLPQLSSGVWYSWIFMIEPITGIILGTYAGFLSTLIGVMVGHFIYFRGVHEFLFTIGAPVGAMVSSLMFRGKWKPVFAYYTVFLITYFITPIAWQLPIWGMWNTYLAYLCLVVFTTLGRDVLKLESNKPSYALALSAFIGLEADILFRIFIFIPCQTYQLFYGFTVETLQYIWSTAAIITPIQVAMSVLMTTIIGPPVIKVLKDAAFV